MTRLQGIAPFEVCYSSRSPQAQPGVGDYHETSAASGGAMCGLPILGDWMQSQNIQASIDPHNIPCHHVSIPHLSSWADVAQSTHLQLASICCRQASLGKYMSPACICKT